MPKYLDATGAVVEGTREEWSADKPSLMVHLASGSVVPFSELTPLTDAGAPIPKLTTVTLAEATKIQTEYERGYRQPPVMKAIKDARAEAMAKKLDQQQMRDHLAPIYLTVRAPMLARRGFPQTEEGMTAFEALTREYTVDGKHTSKPKSDLPLDELNGLVSRNKRVVALMNGEDPAKVKNPITNELAIEGLEEALAEPSRAPLPPASVGVDPADLKEGDPWTMEELEDIRDECFAADVDIDFDKLSIMSRERVEQYFVDGS